MGVIGVAAIWTMLLLIKPLIESVKISLSIQNNHSAKRTEQDMSFKSIVILLAVIALILVCTFYYFVSAIALPAVWTWAIVLLVTCITFLIGFFISATCAYMSGLVGSSSSPVSSIGILTVVLLGVGRYLNLTETVAGTQFLTALTLFGASAVFAVATIATDNLQDLKTGYLVY